MFPVLRERSDIVFRGVAYRVCDRVQRTFSSGDPHGPSCFSTEVRVALTERVVISTTSNVNLIPWFELEDLWQHKIPCVHGDDFPPSRDSQGGQSIVEEDGNWAAPRANFVNILYYLRCVGIVSDEPQLIFLRPLREILAMVIQITNTEVVGISSIQSDVECKSSHVRIGNSRMISWHEWIRSAGPILEPNQSIPL